MYIAAIALEAQTQIATLVQQSFTLKARSRQTCRRNGH